MLKINNCCCLIINQYEVQTVPKYYSQQNMCLDITASHLKALSRW